MSFACLPAHVMRVKADGSTTQRRYWSPAEIKPVRRSSDQAYADGLRACLDLAVRRQMRSTHPIGSLLSGGLNSSSVSILAARALAEKNERLVAFTGVPRRGFDGPLPNGAYADETPYVEAIAGAARNIDVTYVRSDAPDDLAELERFFSALEGPVRNPTNLGWILALLRQARAQGRRVLLGGLSGNCDHQLERLVAGGRSSQARAAPYRLPAMAALLPPHLAFTLGGAAKALCRTVAARVG